MQLQTRTLLARPQPPPRRASGEGAACSSPLPSPRHVSAPAQEQPVIKETIGASAIHPRPMQFNPQADDMMDHSYHPAVHQTL